MRETVAKFMKPISHVVQLSFGPTSLVNNCRRHVVAVQLIRRIADAD